MTDFGEITMRELVASYRRAIAHAANLQPLPSPSRAATSAAAGAAIPVGVAAFLGSPVLLLAALALWVAVCVVALFLAPWRQRRRRSRQLLVLVPQGSELTPRTTDADAVRLVGVRRDYILLRDEDGTICFLPRRYARKPADRGRNGALGSDPSH